MKAPKILTIRELLRVNSLDATRNHAERIAVAMQANHAVIRLSEGLAALGEMATEYTDGHTHARNGVPDMLSLIHETAAIVSGLASLADAELEIAVRAMEGARC